MINNTTPANIEHAYTRLVSLMEQASVPSRLCIAHERDAGERETGAVHQPIE